MDRFEQHRRQMDDMRRSRERQMGALAAIIVAFWGAIICGAIWLLSNPQAVGAFFGRIYAGFVGAA